MKKTKSVKCNSVLKQVEQKSLADDQYCKIFDFHCLTRVQNNAERWSIDRKVDNKGQKKLKSSLEKGELGLVLAERLRKKDLPGKLKMPILKETKFSFFQKEWKILTQPLFISWKEKVVITD